MCGVRVRTVVAKRAKVWGSPIKNLIVGKWQDRGFEESTA